MRPFLTKENFLLAAARGEIAVIRDYLAENINSAYLVTDMLGRDALMLATANNHPEVVRALVAAQEADLTARDLENISALELAQSKGYTEITAEIISAFPEAFDHAIKIGNHASVQQYIAAPDFYNIRDRLSMGLVNAAKGGFDQIVLTLLKAPDITADKSDGEGCTALIYTVTRCHPDTLRAVLAVPQVNVNAQSHSSGWTALMFAAAFSNIQAAEILLQDPRVDLSIKNHYHHSARELVHNDVKGHTILRLLDETERARHQPVLLHK